MPRFFSSCWVSKNASPLSTLPKFLIFPARYSKASERVVLPASTWATIPVVIFFIIFHLKKVSYLKDKIPFSLIQLILLLKIILHQFNEFWIIFHFKNWVQMERIFTVTVIVPDAIKAIFFCT